MIDPITNDCVSGDGSERGAAATPQSPRPPESTRCTCGEGDCWECGRGVSLAAAPGCACFYCGRAAERARAGRVLDVYDTALSPDILTNAGHATVAGSRGHESARRENAESATDGERRPSAKRDLGHAQPPPAQNGNGAAEQSAASDRACGDAKWSGDATARRDGQSIPLVRTGPGGAYVRDLLDADPDDLLDEEPLTARDWITVALSLAVIVGVFWAAWEIVR